MRSILGIVEAVIENFPQSGCDRSQLWSQPRWKFIQHAGKALRDQLANAVEINAVTKRHCHLRKAELRERPQFDHVRQAGHFAFNGKSYQFFHLLRSQRRYLGVDLYLRIRNVRNGIDGQPQGGPHSTAVTTSMASSTAGRCRITISNSRDSMILMSAGAGFSTAQHLQLGHPE